MNKIEILQRLVAIREFELKQAIRDAKHPEEQDKDVAFDAFDGLINDLFEDLKTEGSEGMEKKNDQNRNIREFN
jgi:hypothetical protein